MATARVDVAGAAGHSRPTLEGFDPLSPEFLADPFPTWARAQRECPVFFYPQMNFWVLTKHADVLRAVSDWQTFSSRAVGTLPPPPELAQIVPDRFFHDSFVAIDPPEHTVSRKTANTGFTRSRITQLEPTIAAIADRLIDSFIADGECDLMTQYCYQLSLRTIVTLLGIDDSEENLIRYRHWTEDMFSLLTPITESSGDSTHRAMPENEWRERWGRIAEMLEQWRELIKQRHEHPTEDLITTLVNAKDAAGDPALTEARILTHIGEMIAAGTDTTANLMGSLLLYLSEQPADFTAVRADPALIPAAVEEGLRRRGSSIGMFRLTTADVTVSDVLIPQGSLVFLGFQAAGHDPDVFPDPRRIDFKRENSDDHLSFGRGRHFCMGAPLARVEARIGFERLFSRIPSVEVDRTRPVEFMPTMTVSMLRSLHVVWH